MDKKLYTAATSGNVEALSKLGQDRDLNIFHEITPTRNTALHLAAFHGHLQIVQKLIQLVDQDVEAGNQGSGVFPSAENLEGNTAFHEAAMGGHYKVVEILLEHYPHLVDGINNAGETALFKAAEEGHKRIVEKLLPLTSAEYDRRTSDGQTLVHRAVCNRHKGVIKKIIHHKPDLLKQTDNSQRTPLHTAAYFKETSQIAKMLLDKDSSLCYLVDNNGQSALHIAVKEGNVDLAREILNHGKDCLEIVDNDGRHALHLTVENAVQIFDRISRRIKTLLLLVTSARLINNPDNHGKTALDMAVDNMGNDERLFIGIKRLLEKNGGRSTPKTVEAEATESSLASEKSIWKIQIVSVNAVLIATVAFAAAFTLPKEDPHHSDDPHANFYQTVVICVTIAFCSSIASAVLLMYALYGKQEDSLLLQTAIKGLWIALVALLVAFGAGVYLVVAPKHIVVALVVLVMVCGVPICIRIMIFRSKEYIFSEHETELWTLILLCAVNIYLWLGFLFKENDFYEVQLSILVVVQLGTAWILVSTCLRRKTFRSKQPILRDLGVSIWFCIISFIANGFFIYVILMVK